MRPVRLATVLGAPSPVIAALVLSLCYGCALFQRLAFQSVGPRLAIELGLDAARLADLGASFFWAYLLLMIPCGILVDALGPRRMAMVGALLSSAGCALFAVADSLVGLVLARVVISAGGAFAFVCMMRFIGTSFAARKATIAGRGILVGNLGAFCAGAPLSLLLVYLHWRELWGLLAVGWLALAVALWHRVPPDAPARLGSMRPAVLWAELRSIFGAASTYLGILVVAGLAGTYWAVANFVGPRALALYGLSPLAIGVAVSVLVCGYAVGAAFWGWLGDRAPREGLVVLACASTGAIWLAFATLGPLSPAIAVALLFACGFGSGAFGLIYVILTERHPARQSGLVIACVNCGIPLGAAVLQATAGRLPGASTLLPVLAGSLVATLAAIALYADGGAATRSVRRAIQ